MKTPNELTDAHIVLSAVQATSEGDLDSLSRIVRWQPEIFSNTFIYRLLLSFYPAETCGPSALVEFLQSLGNQINDAKGSETPSFEPSISNLTKNEALRRCRALRLRPISAHGPIPTRNELANVIIEWAKRLEQFHGSAQPAVEFVQNFVGQDSDLRLWYETYLVPVIRLQYEFYPDNEEVIGLQDIERLSDSEGIQTLLQFAVKRHNASEVARDLNYVVSPWVRGASEAKRRRVDHSAEDTTAETEPWESVYDWLISTSMTEFSVAAKAYADWNGPMDDHQPTNESAARFAQTGLALIYGCSELSSEARSVCRQVLIKAAKLLSLGLPDFSQPEPDISLPEGYAKDLDETDLLVNSRLKKSNKFTRANESSVQLLTGIFATAEILSGFGLPRTISELAHVAIFGSERRHKDELRRLLQHIPLQTRQEIDWRSVRRRLLWLQSWTNTQHMETSQQRTAFLSRLPVSFVETQILDALLKAAQFGIVKEVYLDRPFATLSVSAIEARVVAAILEAYDNASNGNRDRGGMKRASEILRAFRPNFSQSAALSDIDHLIKATHSLSFYQLTLQHGVPFKPVSIRVQKDPLNLVEKVLEQDARAYTKLEDLLEIGRNLVRAHLPNRGNVVTEDAEPLQSRLLDAEHRITYQAIMAALGANDFDTAYAYITTRLNTSAEQSATSGFVDDISWRAAYAAGKYRPGSSPRSLNARIDSLTQRMELLSRALMLAPSGEALSGILATWRRYEEELDGLKTQAVEEERAFDAKADASVPGAFGLDNRDADVAETKRAMARRSGPIGSGPSYEEEAPLGLFDVARGAAAALRKSAAFPLGSNGLRDLKIHPETARRHDMQREQAGSPVSDDGGRVRKRDMVANMVTSGLVSGMGWVLGAQPRDRVDYRGESQQ
ncbi:uncharacterized protein Z520_04678 [Fonsecaea multimorphosa CBS 102226]|uniref:Sec39 domain-containing protein n=1 Tax=Fonsecaea multimorphosa CBS 102226 TaxID=1442371 RepID=A0A0D2KA50_9EURO|nr:uncharacterized protein Z520_04678 [Fonsecaea multimorphosa CBS 102226]KIY00040.1 hypothetical protein Z520_04678 [Fonsecaea multimorphosa CBS 102226]OAL26249.1 hypothetical protein AYO22_04427 [Fonsecaea multimorphosa]